MIKGKFYMDKPEEMDCTIVITMPLKDWESLREGIQDKYPSSQLKRIITDLVSAAGKVFTEQADDDADAH